MTAAPAPAWAGLTAEAVDAIAQGLLASVDKAEALVTAKAISAGELRELVNGFEETVARALQSAGCPWADLGGWLKAIANRAAQIRLRDMPVHGIA